MSGDTQNRAKDLTKMTRSELAVVLRRQEKLLSSGVLRKLADGGDKVRQYVEKITTEMSTRDEASGALGEVPDEVIDDALLPLLEALRLATPGTKGNLRPPEAGGGKPVSSLFFNAKSEKSESSSLGNSNRTTLDKTNPTPRIPPQRSNLSWPMRGQGHLKPIDEDDHALPAAALTRSTAAAGNPADAAQGSGCTSRGQKKAVSANVPAYADAVGLPFKLARSKCDCAKGLSLEESMKIQQKLRAKLEMTQMQYAVNRLQARSEPRGGVGHLNQLSGDKPPTSVTYFEGEASSTSYREAGQSDSEEEREDDSD